MLASSTESTPAGAKRPRTTPGSELEVLINAPEPVEWQVLVAGPDATWEADFRGRFDTGVDTTVEAM